MKCRLGDSICPMVAEHVIRRTFCRLPDPWCYRLTAVQMISSCRWFNAQAVVFAGWQFMRNPGGAVWILSPGPILPTMSAKVT